MRIAALLLIPAFAGTGAVAGAAEPESLYNQTCIACHGGNGKGALPGVPDFTTDKGPLSLKSDADLAGSILNGYQSPGSPMAMPAKGGNPALTEEDAVALVHFLREKFRAGSD